MKSTPPQDKPHTELIYGPQALTEAIKSEKTISKVYIDRARKDKLTSDLSNLIKKLNIPCSYVPKVKLDNLSNRNHQGVLAYTSAIDFCDLGSILELSFEKGSCPLILLLNKITDIRNLGAIVRTAECAGVDTIVVDKGCGALNGDCMKTSAGALARLPVCRTTDMNSTIKYIKDSGILLAACTEKAQQEIYTHDLTHPLAIIIGAEGSGIDNQILQQVDIKFKIPMQGQISSLNVSVAAAIAIYEAFRQRKN